MVTSIKPSPTTAEQKALEINLDGSIYGTFAEIGAAQEVARCFFRVGGASGTVAKTISAYDMTMSDEIYGKAARYVSKDRLLKMLQHEYDLVIQRLTEKMGKARRFFAFADTVSTINFAGTNESHGWIGIRFQLEPMSEPSQVVLHVRMLDKANILQQQALGILGVNIIYGAYYYKSDSEKFISGLLDGLSIERIEIDMIEFTGPAWNDFDNRIMSLKLVEKGLTNAIVLGQDSKVYQPSEILRKKPILITRGSFRPLTNVNVDMVDSALRQFAALPHVKDKEPLAVFEISLNNLLSQGVLDNNDFLIRADMISSLGYPVLITNYPEFYRLVGYLRRYTSEDIAVVMGINALLQVFSDKYYEDLEGGTLEALGRLFKKGVKFYLYPSTREDYIRAATDSNLAQLPSDCSALPSVVTVGDLRIQPHLQHLYLHLLEAGFLEGIGHYNQTYLKINAPAVLSQIQTGIAGWEAQVPQSAALLIKERKAFGYPG